MLDVQYDPNPTDVHLETRSGSNTLSMRRILTDIHDGVTLFHRPGRCASFRRLPRPDRPNDQPTERTAERRPLRMHTFYRAGCSTFDCQLSAANSSLCARRIAYTVIPYGSVVTPRYDASTLRLLTSWPNEHTHALLAAYACDSAALATLNAKRWTATDAPPPAARPLLTLCTFPMLHTAQLPAPHDGTGACDYCVDTRCRTGEFFSFVVSTWEGGNLGLVLTGPVFPFCGGMGCVVDCWVRSFITPPPSPSLVKKRLTSSRSCADSWTTRRSTTPGCARASSRRVP